MAAFKKRTAEPRARIKRIYSPPLLIVTSSEFIFNNIYKYFRFAIIFVHYCLLGIAQALDGACWGDR